MTGNRTFQVLLIITLFMSGRSFAEVSSEIPITLTGQFQFLSEYRDGSLDLKLGKTELGIKSNITKTFGLRLIYKVYSDFKVALFDGYAFIKPTPKMEFQLGQFKTPFSLENATAPYKRDFIDEALATLLVNTRDLGLGVNYIPDFGEFGMALINGEGLNKGDINSEKDFVGRACFIRKKYWLVGGGFYFGKTGPDSALAEIERYNFQLHFRKPFSHILQFEYTTSKIQQIKTDAYYLTVGYNLKSVLTGGLLIEPLIRYEYDKVSENNYNGQYLTLGINYYLEENYKVRFQINWRDRLTPHGTVADKFSAGLYYAFN